MLITLSQLLMKLSIYILSISIIALIGCSNEPYKCNCDKSEIYRNDSILSSKETIIGYPRFLKRYKQESLTKQEDESYRLSTKSFFNKYYQVYTLTKSDTGADFLFQEYLSSKPYAIDSKLDNEHHKALSISEWSSFKKIINDNCFWTLRMDDPDAGTTLDGGECYIEGFQPDKRNCSNSDYIMTFRINPSTSGKFNNVYNALAEMIDTNVVHWPR